MPVDPDISQSTAGGGYQPGLDPDYDPDQVSSRPNVDSVSKPKRPREKEEPFNIRTAIPTALPKISEGGTSDDAYRAEMHKESLDADRKAEGKKQASKKLAAKDSSGQGGQSQGSDGEQGAQGQPGQYKSPYKFPTVSGGASGGGGKTGLPGGAGVAGAKGAGAGNAAGIDPQQIQRGITSAAQRAAQGDFKGAGKEAAQTAATVGAEFAEARAINFLMAWAIPTLGLSLAIGGTALLFANLFVNKKSGTKIEIPSAEKYLILAVDAAWGLIILLCILVATAAFCYTLSAPSLKDRLYSLAASPGGAIAGEVGRLVLPQGAVDFCGSLTGNTASSGQGTASGSIGGPAISGCRNVENKACNRLNISACSGMASQMDNALRVCNKESGGEPVPSTTDKCYELSTKQKVSFSWGLWQINILNSATKYPECRGVLQKVEPAGRDCTVSKPYDEGLYNGADCSCRFGPGGAAAFKVCTDALIADSARNTAQACELFNTPDSKRPGGIRGWEPWLTSARACNVPGY